MEIFNDNCLEKMKDFSNNSIDLLFCDLPYGQTSCKWDCLIDLDLFWKQVNRICKDDAAMFFTCSTKFGVSLINSNPKHFRYDLVWVKSAACGFLNAKKMPMKKHEMVYVFYKKLPKVYTDNIAEYHTHKFIKEGKSTTGDKGNECYGKFSYFNNGEKGYDPPLPTSVIKDDNLCNYDVNKNAYGGGTEGRIKISKDKREHETRYEPPLPNSILEIASQKGKHATQKPVDLIKWCLKYYSKEGDVILDPTMGSGSTGIACKEMNRKFIGIEMNEDIFEVAKLRLLL
jgi:site-specific DNA-methyltransferase (adenine-specific)